PDSGGPPLYAAHGPLSRKPCSPARPATRPTPPPYPGRPPTDHGSCTPPRSDPAASPSDPQPTSWTTTRPPQTTTREGSRAPTMLRPTLRRSPGQAEGTGPGPGAYPSRGCGRPVRRSSPDLPQLDNLGVDVVEGRFGARSKPVRRVIALRRRPAVARAATPGRTRQWFVLPPVRVEPRRSVLGELIRPVRVVRVPACPGRDALRGGPLDRLAPCLPCLPLRFLAGIGRPERLELG